MIINNTIDTAPQSEIENRLKILLKIVESAKPLLDTKIVEFVKTKNAIGFFRESNRYSVRLNQRQVQESTPNSTLSKFIKHVKDFVNPSLSPEQEVIEDLQQAFLQIEQFENQICNDFVERAHDPRRLNEEQILRCQETLKKISKDLLAFCKPGRYQNLGEIPLKMYVKISETRKRILDELDRRHGLQNPVVDSEQIEASLINRELNREDIDGSMWEIREKIADPESEGYKFTFRLRDEFNIFHCQTQEEWTIRKKNADTKYKSIFPAVESIELPLQLLENPLDILRFNFLTEKFADNEELKNKKFASIKSRQLFYETGRKIQSLGFKLEETEDGLFLTIPDLKMLHHNWNKFRAENPLLPPLKVIYSEGIATDEEYIQAFAAGPNRVDCIISTKGEFIHDNTVHLLPLLMRILEESKLDRNRYENATREFAYNISHFHEMILRAKDFIQIERDQGEDVSKETNAIDLATLSLGVLIDNYSSRNDFDAFFESSSRDMFIKTLKDIHDKYSVYSSNPHAYLKSRQLPVNTNFSEVWDTVADLAVKQRYPFGKRT